MRMELHIVTVQEHNMYNGSKLFKYTPLIYLLLFQIVICLFLNDSLYKRMFIYDV